MAYINLLFIWYVKLNFEKEEKNTSSPFESLGIITNIFTVIVLIHPRMRNSSTHVYLMALSACNVFLLVGLMINYSLKSIGKYLFNSFILLLEFN